MKRLYIFPLLFLLIGSLAGLILRFSFLQPLPNFTYSNFLHTHSHLMFLGWIFNALYLFMLFHYIQDHKKQKFNKLFVILQFSLIGMLFSFPAQGYGLFSIIFSTLHTIGVTLFIFWFFNSVKKTPSLPITYFKTALIFFLLSAAGPLVLGPLSAMGLSHSKGYFLALYYYLHFQYNGVFFFGIMGILLQLLQEKNIPLNQNTFRTAHPIFVIICILTYSLSTLWAEPGGPFILLGFLSGSLQLVLGFIVVTQLVKLKSQWKKFKPVSRVLLITTALSFLAKIILQALSAIPSISLLAYEVRPYIIAYLHLVLLGVISPVLFIWYVEKDMINAPWSSSSIFFYLLGWLGMEVLLIAPPLHIFPFLLPYMSGGLFLFSGFITVATLLFLLGIHAGKKSQTPL